MLCIGTKAFVWSAAMAPASRATPTTSPFLLTLSTKCRQVGLGKKTLAEATACEALLSDDTHCAGLVMFRTISPASDCWCLYSPLLPPVLLSRRISLSLKGLLSLGSNTDPSVHLSTDLPVCCRRRECRRLMAANETAVRASISTPVCPEAVAAAVRMTSLPVEQSGDGGQGLN